MKRSTPDRNRDPKTEALREQGALHPNPEGVEDEAFRRDEFFDARDRVQVRYEMLRRHRVDEEAVTDVAAAFGVSRQAFYTTEAAFEERGVAGLLPRRRGPKRAHKCTDEILDFVEQWRQASPEAGGEDVARVVQKRFGVSMHPRSIDRALARRRKKKNGDSTPEALMFERLSTIDWEQAYENLRREALASGPRGHGLGLFLSRGMMVGLRALTVLEPRPVPAIRLQHETAEQPAAVNADWTLLLAGMVLSCLDRERV